MAKWQFSKGHTWNEALILATTLNQPRWYCPKIRYGKKGCKLSLRKQIQSGPESSSRALCQRTVKFTLQIRNCSNLRLTFYFQKSVVTHVAQFSIKVKSNNRYPSSFNTLKGLLSFSKLFMKRFLPLSPCSISGLSHGRLREEQKLKNFLESQRFASGLISLGHCNAFFA